MSYKHSLILPCVTRANSLTWGYVPTHALLKFILISHFACFVNGISASPEADPDQGSCTQPELTEEGHGSPRAFFQAKRQTLKKPGIPLSAMDRRADSDSRRYARLEREVKDVEETGFAVVIPGLGTYYRAALVAQNLKWMKEQDIPFECWIFVYPSEEEFPLLESRFEPCQLVRHPGYWMAHVLAMPLNVTKKPWVIHMLDGVAPNRDVNLTNMFQIMRANSLGHAAPTFDTENATYVPQYPLMARQANVTIGRFVDFIELHFDVFSRRYFACLQDNIDSDNTLGWGMDLLLPALCGGFVRDSEVDAGQLGLLDQMTMEKKFKGGYEHSEAGQQMNLYLGKHPGIQRPGFKTLGELER
jgi:hypothetical protein